MTNDQRLTTKPPRSQVILAEPALGPPEEFLNSLSYVLYHVLA
jgi:hypothetical protein